MMSSPLRLDLVGMPLHDPVPTQPVVIFGLAGLRQAGIGKT